MTLYARSDLMSVSIPVGSGGCGKTHSRPVTRGAIAKVWGLNCQSCEAYLRGEGKPKIIRVTPADKDKGIPSRMKHVADSDPHWASTPESVPKTPDEESIHSVRTELGSQQLKMLEAFAAANAAGIDIPPDAMWVLEQNFDPRILKGKLLCPNGHENPAGVKFCGECGDPVTGKAPKGSLPAAEENSLASLSINALRAMAKEQGLPANGSKAALIERLS